MSANGNPSETRSITISTRTKSHQIFTPLTKGLLSKETQHFTLPSFADIFLPAQAAPFSHAFAKQLQIDANNSGLLFVLKRSPIWIRQNLSLRLDDTYRPNFLSATISNQNIEFDFNGAHSVYNWEVFFHIPMLIAKLLMEQRSFERAREWIHCIFDPTNTVDSSDPVQARHWRLRPDLAPRKWTRRNVSPAV